MIIGRVELNAKQETASSCPSNISITLPNSMS